MLKSMTGFARSDGALGPVGWHWEVRTVNGRGYDLRLRLPPGSESLEQRARDACKQRFARGNCSVTLSLKRDAGDVELRLNEAVLRQVSAAIDKARGIVDAAPPSLDGLLMLRGVLETVEPEEEDAAAAERQAAILGDLERALDGVVEARRAEGAHLAAAIGEHLDEIERLIAAAEALPAGRPEAIRERLRESVARLLEEAPQLDEARLYQEAVLLASRADINEEIDRLKAHVAAGRALIAATEPAGRQFEFLAQELNREVNTICSKSGDIELTRTGLALKAVVDRLREQVQNIE